MKLLFCDYFLTLCPYLSFINFMENYNQQNDFSNYTVISSQQTATGAISKKFMANVFGWMFIALGISTVMAFVFAASPALISNLVETTAKGTRMSGLGWLVTLA